MIRSISLRGFGRAPDIAVDISSTGTTTITGPSGAGKSMLYYTASICLTGKTPTGGSPAITPTLATFSVTTAKGSTVEKRLSPRGDWSRSLTLPGGEARSIATESELRALLGKIGANPEAVRAIMIPGVWMDLIRAEKGRPFRDVLVSILPAGDLRAEVAAMMAPLEMRDTDPVDVKIAEGNRKEANRRRDEAAGRLAEAKGRKPVDAVAGPTAEQIEEAHEAIDLADAWMKYDASAGAVREREAAIKTATTQRDDWSKRKATLGTRPIGDAPALAAKRTTLARTQTIVGELERRAGWARGEVERAKAALAEANAPPVAGKCGACGQTLPKAKKGPPDLDGLNAAIVTAEEVAEKAEETFRTNIAALDALRAEIETLRVAESAGESWDVAERALGSEPKIPALPTAPHAAPTTPRPASVSDSRLILDAATTAKGAAAQRERDIASAAKAVAEADAANKTAITDASRLDALVDACRRAPSVLAAKQMGALGDTGPVTIRFPERVNAQTPEVEVLYDGGAWEERSTGERILIGYLVQTAMRRAFGLPIPIFVDEAQSYSGAYPPADGGPVVYLRTATGALTVEKSP